MIFAYASAAGAAPAAPEHLAATPGNASVGLVWDAPGGDVQAYVVYTDLTETARISAVGSLPPNNWYIVRSLDNGTAYTFSVSAVDASGEGPKSVTVSAVPVVPAQAPSGLTAAIVNTPSVRAELAWTPAVQGTLPIAGYSIFRAAGSSAPVWYAYLTAPAAAYIDPNVTTTGAYGAYTYQTAAVDQAGNLGFLSNTVLASAAGAPYAPSNLTATSNIGGVALSWSAVSGANSLNLVVASAPDNTHTVASYVLPGAAATTSVALASDGETYYFSLATVSGGQIGERAVISARTLPPEVSVASGTSGSGYAQLSWTASSSSGVTGYNIRSGGTLVAFVPVPRASHTDSNPKTSYLITAVNSAGESPSGVTVTPVASSSQPPAPTGFQAGVGISQTVSFTWDSAPAGYDGGTFALAALDGPFDVWTLPGDATTTTVASGLVNGQAYRFALALVDSVGNSRFTETLTACPLAAPTDFQSQCRNNTVLLSWDPGVTPSGARYILARTDPGASYPATLTQTAQTGYVDAGLPAGTYEYRLTVLDALEREVPDASALTLSAAIDVPPQPPARLALNAGDGRVEIIWQSVSSANTYNLYRTTAAGYYDNTPLQRGLTSKTTMTVDSSGLTNTVRYYYSLSAVNDAGESTRSAEAAIIPFAPAVLPQDARLRASQLRRMISLSWNPSAPGSYPIIGYDVYRSTDGGGRFVLLGNTPTVSAGTAHEDRDVDYGQTYIYRVHALNPADADGVQHEGPAYSLLSVHVDQPANRIEVYRNAFNPVRGEFATVHLVQVQPGRTWIRIYTASGELIRVLFDQDLPAGYTPEYPFVQDINWDGRNERGEIVASGVYLIHAEGQSRYHQTRKVAVIK